MMNEGSEEKLHPKSRPPSMLPKPPGFNIATANEHPRYMPLTPCQPVFERERRRLRRKRKFGCKCCLCSCLIVFVLLIILVIAVGVAYYFLRPQAPTFHVNSVKIVALNVTRDSKLTCDVQLSMDIKNPNKHLGFGYGKSLIWVSYLDDRTQDETSLGTGTYPAFVNGKQNLTVIKVDMQSAGLTIGSSTARDLMADFAEKRLHLKIRLKTHVRGIIHNWKSPKVKITVQCSKLTSTKNAKCKIIFFNNLFRFTLK